jgi:hypothetical protein
MDMAMEMVMPETSIAAETTCEATLQAIERNSNRMRRRRSEVPVTAWALGDWRSRMERMIRQQAQELMQLHRTVQHIANLLEARVDCEEAQRPKMMTCMQEKEQKWDACHEDDKLWGAGITNMIAKSMEGAAPGEKASEKEREKTPRMDSGGLESAQHADTKREEGPEKCQQPQQQPKPKLQLKLQPKLQPAPRPSQQPHPLEGGRPSHPKPGGKTRAQPQNRAQVWQRDGWSSDGMKASPNPI